MRIGSIVECVDPYPGFPEFGVLPLFKVAYTIRAFCSDGNIYLEEIINPIQFCDDLYGGVVWMEPAYKRSRFREVQFPSDLETQIQECLTRRLEPVELK